MSHLATRTSTLLFIVYAIGLANTGLAADQTGAAKIVPVFSWNRPLSEAPVAPDPFLLGVGGESLHDVVTRLETARKDRSVAAVIVLMGPASMGNGQIEELHSALLRLRKAGKPVYAYADSLTFGQLTLLSAATRISVMPVGDVFVTGLYGSQPHLRGLLEKIHVTPDFLTCGEYKSAGEIFMRTEPSPQAARMYDWLYDSLYTTYLGQIAEGRGTNQESVRAWIDQGIFSARRAAAGGLIDATETRAEFLDYVRQQHGSDVRLKKKYARRGPSALDLSNPFSMLKIWSDLLRGSGERESDRAVAVVYVVGPILPGRPQPSPFGSQGVAYSDPIRRALDKVAKDESVKAVVLRVDSPGGSAVASEVILQATRRVAAEKPLVVSMGNVAGSGGYYVSCGAQSIIADAATLTASIGVVAGKLATGPMWDAVGIRWHSLERGKHAGIFAADEVFSASEREELQAWMDEVYGIFKQHVVDIRGDRLQKPIDELAGGRVFTGRQALELGLVDRLGSLRDAIELAASEAGLDEYKVRVVPRPKNVLEQMLSGMSGGDEDNESIRLSPLTSEPWRKALQLVAPHWTRWEPQRVNTIYRALVQLEILQRERLSLAMPEFAFGD